MTAVGRPLAAFLFRLLPASAGVLAGSLLPVGVAAGPLTAADLLAAFEQRLEAARTTEDVSRVEGELARLSLEAIPTVRLSQSTRWHRDSLAGLDLRATVSLPLNDPEGTARYALTAHRLELARHDAGAQRRNRLREFRKTLRVIAHLEEAESVMAAHGERVAAAHPHLREIELSAERAARYAEGTSVPAVSSDTASAVELLDPLQLAYLELVQAQRRSQRERSLLLARIASLLGETSAHAATERLGRPPIPGAADLFACLSGSEIRNDATVRAALRLAEARSDARLDEAASLPVTSLRLNGGAYYRGSGSATPWRGDLNLALDVRLSPRSGFSGGVDVGVDPGGLTQDFTLSWPARGVQEFDGDVAWAQYREALDEAKLVALDSLHALIGAEERLRFRRLELASKRAREVSGGAGSEEVARAELAVLDAELELDLAIIDGAALCGTE